MAQMLEEHLGCRVLTFSRAVDALVALPVCRPAVVISDYHMPELTGIEFIRLAGAIVPAASFLLISGHNLDAVREQLDGLAGLQGCLGKPFGWRRLADEVLRVWPKHVPLPAPRIPVAV
jgi:CheY-like chemotaxis protein